MKLFDSLRKSANKALIDFPGILIQLEEEADLCINCCFALCAFEWHGYFFLSASHTMIFCGDGVIFFISDDKELFTRLSDLATDISS